MTGPYLRLLMFPALGLSLFHSGAHAQLGGNASEFGTRDVGAMAAGCNPVTFIVSFNDDDDNSDGSRDRLRAVVPASEDNLRQINFAQAGATKVFIAEPYILATNSSAVGSRLRAYKSDRTTPFDFTVTHNVPVTLYLEGVGRSTGHRDLGFEYQYFRANGTTLCGPGATGTVIDVKAKISVHTSGGTRFTRNRKMLVTGRGKVKSRTLPNVAGQWRYDGTMTFAAPAAQDSALTAGTTFTPVAQIDRHLVARTVQESGQTVEAVFPVNLTAPRHVTTNSTGFNILTPGWFDPRQGGINLFRAQRIRYTILDQQRRPIKDSAYAKRAPQIRENIGNVMTSPIPAVRQLILQNLNWTQNWKTKKSGRFTDKIEAWGFNRGPFLDPAGGQRFHPNLRVVGGVVMHVNPPNTHDWQVSVSGNVVRTVTTNSFSSVVAATRQRNGRTQIQVRSQYGVVTP